MKRKQLEAGTRVYVNFATGILEGVATGNAKPLTIEVETREWCGDGYYRVKRWHDWGRVHLEIASAEGRAARTLADLMCGFACDTVAQAILFYMSRPDCSQAARDRIKKHFTGKT